MCGNNGGEKASGACYNMPHKVSTTGICYDLSGPDLANVEALDRGALPILHQMMRNGIWLDQTACTDVARRLLTAETEYGDKLAAAVGWRVNPESGDQVARLLWDELQLDQLMPRPPAQTKSRKRLTTDDETLSTLRLTLAGIPGLEPMAEIVDWIIGSRQVNTLRTTFAEPLVEQAQRHKDGRIRTRFKYTTARTGRLASDSPPLQNIPTRTDLGTEIRNCFQAEPGKDTVLVSCDYSQVEMRLVAHMSADPAMCKVFADKLDIHTQTAAAIFRVPPESVDKRTQRLPAKTLGFAILYGVQGDGLQGQIFSAGGPWWDVDECDRLITRWFGVYPEIYRWILLQQSRARRFGMVWDFVGRQRPVPEARSVHERIRDKGFRECGNFPIQAGAQAVIKMAMWALLPVVEHYARRGVCLPLLQVHDELIFEVSSTMAEEFATECRQVMSSVVELAIPLDTSSDYGPKWGSLK